MSTFDRGSNLQPPPAHQVRYFPIRHCLTIVRLQVTVVARLSCSAVRLLGLLGSKSSAPSTTPPSAPRRCSCHRDRSRPLPLPLTLTLTLTLTLPQLLPLPLPKPNPRPKPKPKPRTRRCRSAQPSQAKPGLARSCPCPMPSPARPPALPCPPALPTAQPRLPCPCPCTAQPSKPSQACVARPNLAQPAAQHHPHSIPIPSPFSPSPPHSRAFLPALACPALLEF